jgi:hypothetical protein
MSSPDITAAEIEAVSQVLQTPYLSIGPRIAEFEERFAAYVGARHWRLQWHRRAPSLRHRRWRKRRGFGHLFLILSGAQTAHPRFAISPPKTFWGVNR